MTEKIITLRQSSVNGVPLEISHVSAEDYKITITGTKGEWVQGEHYFKWRLDSGEWEFTTTLYPFNIVHKGVENE